MPDETIGEDLKIYEPMNEAILRNLQGLSTVQGQKELDQIKSMMSKESTMVPNAINQATGTQIGAIGGDAVMNANLGDLAQRKALIMNNYYDNLYDSERKFVDAIKTKGLDNALKMFTSQLGAKTNTYVAQQQNAAQQNQMQQMMQFTQKESELDRALQREDIAMRMRIAQKEQKSQRAKGIGGLFGSLLGGVLGFTGLDGLFGGGD